MVCKGTAKVGWKSPSLHWGWSAKSPPLWFLGLLNKSTGGDGIPVELFQILKDDAVKVTALNMPSNLENSAVATGLEKVSFHSSPEECSNYRTIALISHASTVMLKILQGRLQKYMNCELPVVQADFRKGRGTRDQIANIRWIIKI